MTPELEAENRQVLCLVQAMLGLITPNIRAVALQMRPEGRVEAWFVVERDDPETTEDLQDIIADFEALQTGPIVDVRILVDSRPFHELGLPERLVYCRKEAGCADLSLAMAMISK